MDEVESFTKQMAEDKVNPMDLKKKLAHIITAEHKGENAAAKAQKHFETVFQNRETGEEGGENTLPEIKVGAEKASIITLLTTHTGFAESNSQAKRLVEQGAVSIDGKKVVDKTALISIPPDGLSFRAGRHAAHITR
jgi:tyrosyl-tRNA synthetase